MHNGMLQRVFWGLALASALCGFLERDLASMQVLLTERAASSVCVCTGAAMLLALCYVDYHAPTPAKCRCLGGSIALMLQCQSVSGPWGAACALACGYVFSPFPPKKISNFAAKQRITFKLVASSTQDNWSEKTFCGRILLDSGVEYEINAQKEAKTQWSELEAGVAYTMDFPRSCVKKYGAADKTGIKQEFMLKMQYKSPTLERAKNSFSDGVVVERECVKCEEVNQQATGDIFNVAGVVKHCGAPPDTTGTGALARRSLNLQDGDWELTVVCVGDLAKKSFRPGARIFVAGVRKNDWMGMVTVETTRLSWIVEGADWIAVERATEGTPPRKALRMSASEPVRVTDLAAAGEKETRTVEAQMVELTDQIFLENLWYGENGDQMRLPIRLRDDHGSVSATLWSREFPGIVSLNLQEIGNLWSTLDTDDADDSKEKLLQAFNAKAGASMRWMLRPRLWTPSGQDPQVTWTVVAVEELPGN